MKVTRITQAEGKTIETFIFSEHDDTALIQFADKTTARLSVINGMLECEIAGE